MLTFQHFKVVNFGIAALFDIKTIYNIQIGQNNQKLISL